MTTMSKNDKTKKKGRWQAVMLAALVLAGSVAVPQAADASTKSGSCGYWNTSCSTTVKATSNQVRFKVTSNTPNATMSYSVKASNGRTLCSGTVVLNGNIRVCSLGGHRGTMKITVSKPWASNTTIRATY